MRIDKFLKTSRILKRRVIGKELAENDRLYINDRLAKASSEVKVGDRIKIVFGHREIEVRVLNVLEKASKEDAFSMYEVLEEKKQEPAQ